MATKANDSDGFTFNYEMKLDFNELGNPSSLYIKAEPEEQAAVDSAIRAALAATHDRDSKCDRTSPQKPFREAITEYFSKSQTKPWWKRRLPNNLGNLLA